MRSWEGSSCLLLVQVRLSWAAFSPAPKIFLWKSPDRTEKILRMGATRRGKLRTFSRRSRFRASAVITRDRGRVENASNGEARSGLIWVLTNAASQRLKDDT